MTDKDVKILGLLARTLRDSSERHGITLDPLACEAIATDLLQVAQEAVRIKRPIHRPKDFHEKQAALVTRINGKSLAKATNHKEPWTGPQLETALRDDITMQQAAEALGRSYFAVKTVRRKYKAGDPRITALVHGSAL